MKLNLLLLWAAIAVPIFVQSQGGGLTQPSGALTVTSSPNGNVCSNTPSQAQAKIFNGTIYTCQSGTYQAVTGTATGTLTGVTASTGLTGGGTSGNVPVALAPAALGTIGGVQAVNASSHLWIDAISTLGVPHVSQPAASDLTNGVTGSGAVILQTSPNLITPTIGGAAITYATTPAATGDATFNVGSGVVAVSKIAGVSPGTLFPLNLPGAGLTKSTGSAFSVAVANTDYLPPASPAITGTATYGGNPFTYAATPTASGDGTFNASTGALAVTKTGGVAFGSLATQTPSAQLEPLASPGSTLTPYSYIAPSGGTGRTQSSKNADIVSVKDFGCVGDGVNNDLPCSQAATDSLTNGGTVCFPSGAYLFDSSVRVTAGDRFNLYTSHDNTAFAPCAGSPIGSVLILQGTNGHGPGGGGLGATAFGPIAIYNSGFFNTSTIGQNGYQNTTQNGGYYTLSPIAAGATSITFSTPTDAGHFAPGDVIAIAESTAQAIVPLETNHVLTANTGTGVVTLAWPQTQAYATAFAANVTPMVRKNISIDGLILRGANSLFINCAENIRITNTAIQGDTTYTGAGAMIFANAVRRMYFGQNSSMAPYPAGTVTHNGANSIELPQNNSSFLTFENFSITAYSVGQGEFIEHNIYKNGKFNLSGSPTGAAVAISGYDVQFKDNTVENTGVPGLGYTDYAPASNPFGWTFGKVDATGNTFTHYATSTNPVVKLFAPDTNFSFNKINAGPTQHALAVSISGAADGNISTSVVIPRYVINGNTFRCVGVGSGGCSQIAGNNVDGGTFTNNVHIDTTATSTQGLSVTDPGTPPATGTMNFGGNTYSGFTTPVVFTAANHPGAAVADSGVGTVTTAVTATTVTGTAFSGTGLTILGNRSFFTAPSSGSSGAVTVTSSSSGANVRVLTITNGSSGSTDLSACLLNQTSGGREMCIINSVSGGFGANHLLFRDYTNSQNWMDCNSVYGCAFQTLSTTGVSSFAGTTNTGIVAGSIQAITAASTIAPTKKFVFLSGVTPVVTMTPPTGCTTAGTDCDVEFLIDPANAGPATWTAAGNMATTFSAAAATRFTMTYHPNLTKWITPAAAGGGTTSPLTTKGDLYGFNTVNARIPVGTNGQVLTADSTNALGVSWQAGGSGTANAFNSGTSLPGTCTVGAVYFITTNTPNQQMYTCSATNTWTQDNLVGGSGALGLNATTGALDVTSFVPLTNTANIFTAAQQAVTIAGTGTATFAPQTGAGTGATAVCSTSHVCDSVSGEIVLTSGSVGTPATGSQLIITLPTTRTNQPNCSVDFEGGTTFLGTTHSTSTTTITVSAGVALTFATAYKVTYLCGGN